MKTKFNETDKMWICSVCGSLNSSWRETCGSCGKEKNRENFKTPDTLDVLTNLFESFGEIYRTNSNKNNRI